MNKINVHRMPSPILCQSQIQAQPPNQSFLEHLHHTTQPEKLKISKHANDRLQERGIQMTDAEWARISEKVDEAKRKGIRESLVLTDQAVLIVSAKNSTVITAMNRMEAKDQLFTNIDGTIVFS
ncbi:flagellar protein [Sporosarcina sp. GW1-11]|uniref:TIGR02530 family flagellar biosynthesis protein n=1 Tax=Sporosarcina sp. GW1-11 TaxID=2899126 RepID=UPI00294CBCD1|nr:TIGR02530 family flagellar biosynthesis protein [Sporosarcina sp. GW1-11]MDV6376711.1 flagellar protein [Sporosarcina sp. GW1-11]